MKRRNLQNKVLAAALSLLTALALGGFYSLHNALAAALSQKSDVMTRLEDGVVSNHTITFTQYTTTQFVAGETITVQFDTVGQGFNLTALSAADPLDYDIRVASTEESIVANGGCASNDAIEVNEVNTSTDTITFTACSSYTSEAAGSTIIIEIGNHASTGGAGNSQITNPGSTGNKTIAIGGTFGDTGDIVVDIIDDDSVNVTATVDESIAFTISDTTIGFGTLSLANARYATGNAAGADADTTYAHQMTIATNAANGYSITYNGPTLTSGLNTITVASINDDANGDPGTTEAFGMSMSTSGNATIASGYNHGDPDWTFVASTPTQIVSETAPTSTETIDVRYIGNINGTTEAGSYSTDVTFVATATF